MEKGPLLVDFWVSFGDLVFNFGILGRVSALFCCIFKAPGAVGTLFSEKSLIYEKCIKKTKENIEF